MQIGIINIYTLTVWTQISKIKKQKMVINILFHFAATDSASLCSIGLWVFVSLIITTPPIKNKERLKWEWIQQRERETTKSWCPDYETATLPNNDLDRLDFNVWPNLKSSGSGPGKYQALGTPSIILSFFILTKKVF